jgi:hypothetical protein
MTDGERSEDPELVARALHGPSLVRAGRVGEPRAYREAGSIVVGFDNAIGRSQP